MIKIQNELGLHIRPAAAIVKLVQSGKSEVFFTYKRERVSAKSIMSILMLAAKKNAEIEVSVQGPDAKEMMKKLVQAFKKNFGE